MTLARRIAVENRRFIYPIVAALVLNAALFVALVYPLSLRVAGGQQSAQTAADALAGARNDYESAKATVSGRASADLELKKFYGAVLPPDLSAARRLIYPKIQEIAERTSVRPATQSMEDEYERGSSLGRLTATVSLTGEYRNIRRLIYELETAPAFLILEKVDLSQQAERDRGLNVVVKISTYFRAASEGNGN
jgi:hypothetical protein